jgi:hypothetical protein
LWFTVSWSFCVRILHTRNQKFFFSKTDNVLASPWSYSFMGSEGSSWGSLSHFNTGPELKQLLPEQACIFSRWKHSPNWGLSYMNDMGEFLRNWTSYRPLFSLVFLGLILQLGWSRVWQIILSRFSFWACLLKSDCVKVILRITLMRKNWIRKSTS